MRIQWIAFYRVRNSNMELHLDCHDDTCLGNSQAGLPKITQLWAIKNHGGIGSTFSCPIGSLYYVHFSSDKSHENHVKLARDADVSLTELHFSDYWTLRFACFPTQTAGVICHLMISLWLGSGDSWTYSSNSFFTVSMYLSWNSSIVSPSLANTGFPKTRRRSLCIKLYIDRYKNQKIINSGESTIIPGTRLNSFDWLAIVNFQIGA